MSNLHVAFAEIPVETIPIDNNERCSLSIDKSPGIDIEFEIEKCVLVRKIGISILLPFCPDSEI
jgi:hypothetical protein